MNDLPDDATIEQCRERLQTVNRCWSDSYCDCHKQLLAERILEHYDALAARLAEADEKLRRIRRMAELSAAMMRDPERTGGWVGSERVARGFERIAERAADSASVTQEQK